MSGWCCRLKTILANLGHYHVEQQDIIGERWLANTLLFQHSLNALAQFGCFAGIASGVGSAHLPQFTDGVLEAGWDVLPWHGLPLERFDPVAPLVTRILAAASVDAPPEYLRVLEVVEVVQKVAYSLPDGFRSVRCALCPYGRQGKERDSQTEHGKAHSVATVH